MYIADMFCYGKSAEFVGVNGIVGCMGVFLAYNKMLYAIHIPDSINYNSVARTEFGKFIGREATGMDGNQAQVVAVLNNDNRPGGPAEVAAICKDLGVPRFTMIRLRKNIPISPSSKEPAAVAVLCEFTPESYVPNVGMQFSDTLRLKYQVDSRVRWEKNRGEARIGQYRAMRDDEKLYVSGALGAGWDWVDTTSGDITVQSA